MIEKVAQGARKRGASRIVGVETNPEKSVKGKYIICSIIYTMRSNCCLEVKKLKSVHQMIFVEVMLLAEANYFKIPNPKAKSFFLVIAAKCSR